MIVGLAPSILRRDRRPTGVPPTPELCARTPLPTDSAPTTTILDEPATLELVDRLARDIAAAVPQEARLVLVGIQRRGDSIARRVATGLVPLRGEVPTGSLDITLYRDDFAQLASMPQVGSSDVPPDITDSHLVIVDDVLYTGRTIRAALNELSDFGRARTIELCVLIDRGGRQLPIQPDYAGRFVEVPPGAQVSVRVGDLDGEWGVDLIDMKRLRETVGGN